MELQFEKHTAEFLRQIRGVTQSQEQTQEVRLGEGMPDVGRVLDAWGQVIIRGKEWQSDSVGVSGGVMAWVLYAPEDGTPAVCVESWLPFTMKWDIPEKNYDGVILCNAALRSVDARPVSGRKLMVRSCVSMLTQAWVREQAEYFVPGQMPEDVFLLQKDYPVELVKEAGEKAFMLDEELTVPQGCPEIGKIVRYHLLPEVVDRKVLGNKAVFRGGATLTVLYRTPEGAMACCNMQIPFSQYTQLEKEYGENAQLTVDPLVTALEVELDDQGRLRLKAGLTGQYTVYDRQVIPVVEDAYSPYRQVALKAEQLEVPAVLEQTAQGIRAEMTAQQGGSRLVDVCFMSDQARKVRQDEQMNMGLSGQFQMLYYDAEGLLQCDIAHWEDSRQIQMDEQTHLDVFMNQSGTAQGQMGAEQTLLSAENVLQTVTWTDQQLQTASGIQIPEKAEPDPDRPTLILCRAGQDSLWQIARKTGSTVEAITQANKLSGEPDPEQMLLIPVL